MVKLWGNHEGSRGSFSLFGCASWIGITLLGYEMRIVQCQVHVVCKDMIDDTTYYTMCTMFARQDKGKGVSSSGGGQKRIRLGASVPAAHPVPKGQKRRFGTRWVVNEGKNGMPCIRSQNTSWRSGLTKRV
ncbi:hypothetical protein HAX54_039930 [Datura stramonium]|uniref:Uncharacterized protein n=1 Tax=Datura stramonium TaxID=4076 RepID=A0ABS8VM11_DATST|nr:hypothetical protein [Datura stramonium]